MPCGHTDHQTPACRYDRRGCSQPRRPRASEQHHPSHRSYPPPLPCWPPLDRARPRAAGDCACITPRASRASGHLKGRQLPRRPETDDPHLQGAPQQHHRACRGGERGPQASCGQLRRRGGPVQRRCAQGCKEVDSRLSEGGQRARCAATCGGLLAAPQHARAHQDQGPAAGGISTQRAALPLPQHEGPAEAPAGGGGRLHGGLQSQDSVRAVEPAEGRLPVPEVSAAAREEGQGRRGGAGAPDFPHTYVAERAGSYTTLCHSHQPSCAVLRVCWMLLPALLCAF